MVRRIVFVIVMVIPWIAQMQSSALEMPAVQPKAFKDLQVIDHWNLRYHKEYEEFSLQEQVAQIKHNMDVAAQLGFTSYLLFQKDAFPELLTWGGSHEPDQELRSAVQDVLDHAASRRLKVYLHCNEFMWPDSVDVPYGDTQQAWQTYRNALKELIALFPNLAGFEVTADETGGALEEKEGVLKFHDETARALRSDGRERLALMRTWQRVGALGSPTTLGKTDAPNVLFSVKNTDGDFGAVKDLDRKFLETVDDPKRLLVEFDAWREYETHNIFPIYLGDYWAPRFRELARLGVERIGVRFNWNSGHFAITQRPWANWVNVFCFVRLAENPNAEPDEILREYVTLYYPPQAREAAFDLYKGSFEFVRGLYWDDDEKITDHGRVNRQRKIGDRRVHNDWCARVDRLTDRMLNKIDALPDSGAYKNELRKGALVVSYLSKACGLQLGAQGNTDFLEDWKRLDPLSFEKLRARYVRETLNEKAGPDGMKATKPDPTEVLEGAIYEAEEAEVVGARIVTKETDDVEFHEGATGEAFVDFHEDSGESITWLIECSKSGKQRLSFRYSLEDEDPRPLRLIVNGLTENESMPFADTGDWDSWASVHVQILLQKGPNTIRLEATGHSGPNIDHLRIEEGQEPPAGLKQALVPHRPGKTVIRDGTVIEFYPNSSFSRSDDRISGTTNGEPLGFEYFRTSREYYYDVSYAWFAADGPIRVDLKVDAPIEHARLRTVLKDIPVEKSGSNLHFSLPGPGHYYLQLPDLGQPEPHNPDCAKDVLIENCLIMSKDDSIAVKTRKPPVATQRIVSRNCIVASDASALKIGTETRALMRDITFENCDVFDSDRGIIMYARDGGPIENVTWRNIRMLMIDWPHETDGSPFQFLVTKRGGFSSVHNCLVENIATSTVAPSAFAGLVEAPLDGLRLRNITLNIGLPRHNMYQPYLFNISDHADVNVDGLVVNWQGRRDRWGGLCKGQELKINQLVEVE